MSNRSDLLKKLEANGFSFVGTGRYKCLIYSADVAASVRKLDENVHKLEQVSGKSMDELTVLFAAGWKLTPPIECCQKLSMLDMEE